MRRVLATLLFLIAGYAANATWSTPGFLTTILSTAPDLQTLNSDMIESLSGDPITVTAWDEWPGWVPNAFFSAQFDTNAPVIIGLPTGAHWPDIAIGDDLASPGNYIVSVVYVENYVVGGVPKSHVILQTYSLVPGIVPVVTLSTTDTLSAATVDKVYYPHIDLFADTRMPGTPTMHEFAISWLETIGAPTVTPEIMVATGDIATPSTFSRTTVVNILSTGTSSFIMPDVTAVHDVNTGDNTAYVVYVEANTSLNIVELPVGTLIPTTPVTVFTGFNLVWWPRIDGLSVDVGGPDAKWQVVAHGEHPSYTTIGEATFSVNSNGVQTCMSNVNFNWGNNEHFLPVVAAGVGSYGPSANVGNGRYITGWAISGWFNMPYVAQELGTSTGTPIGFDHAVSPPLSAFLPNPFLAGANSWFTLATCTNTGYKMYSAYYDQPSNTIRYKHSPNFWFFKQTDVKSITASGDISIYPNPATDHLTVTAVPEGSYTITNITGMVVASGEVSTRNNEIYTGKLTPGMYMLNIHDGVQAKSLQFAKQ
jgi:hypothetical protein